MSNLELILFMAKDADGLSSNNAMVEVQPSLVYSDFESQAIAMPAASSTMQL